MEKQRTMFSHIKEKLILFLKPAEATNHINGCLNLETHIAINCLLLRLIKNIKDIEEAPPTLDSESEITVDTFMDALQKIAQLIAEARQEAAFILKKKKTRKLFDLYLQALQLHLDNYNYYQFIGIDLFNNDTPSGIPSKLFYNMGVTYSGLELSDYVTFMTTGSGPKPQYITPDIIERITEFTIVYVTAIAPNPYGHIILGLGDQGFIHIDGMWDRPHYIPVDQFKEYTLASHMVLGVQHIYVPDMEGAKAKLLELSSKPWLWRAYWANCANFADAVLHAGGVPLAHIDPLHIGDYNHHTQYPIKRLSCAHPTSLDKTAYDSLHPEEEAALKNRHEENLLGRFTQIGKNAGLNDDKAKTYAHYRIHDGLSHKKAQYKTEPSVINFLAMHHHKIENIAILNPLLFILATPVLLVLAAKSIIFNVNCFFHPAKEVKNKRYQETLPQPNDQLPLLIP